MLGCFAEQSATMIHSHTHRLVHDLWTPAPTLHKHMSWNASEAKSEYPSTNACCCFITAIHKTIEAHYINHYVFNHAGECVYFFHPEAWSAYTSHASIYLTDTMTLILTCHECCWHKDTPCVHHMHLSGWFKRTLHISCCSVLSKQTGGIMARTQHALNVPGSKKVVNGVIIAVTVHSQLKAQSNNA